MFFHLIFRVLSFGNVLKQLPKNIRWKNILSYSKVNSPANPLIMTLLTFLKQNMLNPRITLVVYFGHFLLFILAVNLNHKNDIFWILVTHKCCVASTKEVNISIEAGNGVVWFGSKNMQNSNFQDEWR